MRRSGAGLPGAASPGPGIAALQAAIREVSPHLGDDRSLSAEIETVAELVADGTLVAAAEAAGPRLR